METKSQPNGTLRYEVRTEPCDDGSVEFSFSANGKTAVKGRCTPTELSSLVSGFLTSAHFAFHDRDGAHIVSAKYDPIMQVVPTTEWFLGHTNVMGQKAIAVRVGESVIGFAVAEDKMREFGRLLIRASWKTQSAAGSSPLLGSLLKEFFEDFRAWCSLAIDRLKASFRRHRNAFASRISRQAFRAFRTVNFVPNVGFSEYAAVQKCIYCGATVYSERPGFRRYPLGGEHIIAEGLGGTLELPEASCQKCEEITGSVVENDVLSITLKALRVYLKIKGKGRPVPKTLPLTKTDVQPEETVQIPAEDYPVMLLMPIFDAPGIFFGRPGGNQITAGFKWVALHYDERKLRKAYGLTSFATPRWDTHMLFRMLAKIGHSLATAELGDNFLPALADMILNGNTDKFNHIGGDPYLSGLPSSFLHEASLGYQRAHGKDYVVARIRLFANRGGPVYSVVVGESLERPISKLRRSLFARFSKHRREATK